MRRLRQVERLLLILGLMMLAFYLIARIHRVILSQAAVHKFTTDRLRTAEAGSGELTAGTPDFSLWSQKRIQDYEDSLAAHFAPAIAILRIPAIHLEVPVLEGTDDLTLNRGVGRIAGTSQPGESGNIGIAGHRDGFFRGLKDVAPGDRIELITLERKQIYIIDRAFVVDPDDVSVLATLPRPSLTLVTCYPFYFVGSAPSRYIIQASLASPDTPDTHTNVRSNGMTRNTALQESGK